jgi:hypothetical protein
VAEDFLFQLFGALAFQLARLVPLLHVPALSDGGKPGGDFLVIQSFRRPAQAVG